ncbi:MAG: hypothetical protein H6631_10600 [Anaerolineaceae bacterium]|nr:hypothetical protein [Anaerolineaceae bacterium]MCB9100866.1 hypothetical protein [Anaerolineales bacterium]
MYFIHTPIIWQEFPQLVPGMLLVEDIHPQAEIGHLIQPLYQQARARLSQTSEGQMPEVSAWRRVYSQMGLKPTQYRSAAEALLRRFRKEDQLPSLHPLVDFCNAVSVAFALPIAVIDVAHVATFIEVRPAVGSEKYLAFSGEIETPPAGEIIFADAIDEVHARRWTFRQSRRSTISPETRQALIVSEAMHETGLTDMKLLLDTLISGSTELYTAPQKHAILSLEAPRFEF